MRQRGRYFVDRQAERLAQNYLNLEENALGCGPSARTTRLLLCPAGIKTLGNVYGYIVQSGLPRLLVNLVYLRASICGGGTFASFTLNAQATAADSSRSKKIFDVD
jgi:hypothetical protein